MDTVTKKEDIITALAAKLSINKQTARDFYNGVLTLLEEELMAGHVIRLGSIGVLRKVVIKEHTMHGPLTGGTLVVPERYQFKLRSRPKNTKEETHEGEL